LAAKSQRNFTQISVKGHYFEKSHASVIPVGAAKLRHLPDVPEPD
jgi:hypothetical protein